MKFAENNLGLTLKVNNLITIQAAVDWRDVTVGGKYHDFGAQNPRHWYNLSSSKDLGILGLAYGASRVSQSVLEETPLRFVQGIIGKDISGTMAVLSNPTISLVNGLNWMMNKGALGSMNQPNPNLDPYYNGYFGGNFPSFFRLIGTEEMGINAHSAMADNAYERPTAGQGYRESIRPEQRKPVSSFWDFLVGINNGH